MANTNLPTSSILVTVKNLTAYQLALGPPLNTIIPKAGSKVVPINSTADLNSKEVADAVNAGRITISYTDSSAQGGKKSLVNDPILRGELNYCDHFQDCQADAVVVHLRSGALAAGAVLAASFSGVQPDHPRTLRAVVAGASTGTVLIEGIMANGQGGTEAIVCTSATTFEGSVAWATISSITFFALAGGESISMRLSKKLGLVGAISVTGSIYKVTENGVDVAVTAAAVDPANSTFDTAGISAGDDWTIRYRP